ncbi:MAG: anti-sigma factor family protein, partial [Sciscionella sp.]
MTGLFPVQWSLGDAHLQSDAVVAFVDGELSSTASGRVRQHLTDCPFCAAEVSTQHQARGAVREARSPRVPAGLMAALRDIPGSVELSVTPQRLAVSEDGQMVAQQRPEKAKRHHAREARAEMSPLRPSGGGLPARAGFPVVHAHPASRGATPEPAA